MPIRKNFDEDEIQLIHERLKDLRESTETNEKKAISQRQLAKKLNIAYPRISKLENIYDDTEPSVHDLLAYAKYFNVSVDYILGLENEMSRNMDFKVFAKEYGISSKSLVNIKSVLYSDIDPVFYKTSPECALNTLLESNSLESFLVHFIKYLNFYPSSEEYAYIWSGTPSHSDADNLKDDEEYYEIIIKAQADDFFDDPNKAMINTKILENILLDDVKQSLDSIKKSSFEYYKNSCDELKKVTENYYRYLKDIEESEYFNGDSPNVMRVKVDYLKKIKKLEKTIEDYKKKQ